MQGRSPAPPAAEASADALAPLGRSVFRWLWLASLASQMGTWVQNVGAVDLMSALAPTAVMLALVQTATTLPGLFLGLPAGALADVVDRRRLLTSSWWLLGLTFGVGVGGVLALPAWQAITMADRALDRQLRALQEDAAGPVVQHYLYARP